MSKVKFYELERNDELAKIEARINNEINVKGADGASVRLFRTSDGQIGYSANGLPARQGRRVLDIVHRSVCQVIGTTRGRPFKAPTHQVKCRVPEKAYQRLMQEAKKMHLVPSRLAGEMLTQRLGV
ncbi:hypothetical protein HY772_04570 [Candidatus Woesearchaeota archaeon]|nr:hypothetical protein [Candidatus Woesearchaeota archaeon]